MGPNKRVLFHHCEKRSFLFGQGGTSRRFSVLALLGGSPRFVALVADSVLAASSFGSRVVFSLLFSAVLPFVGLLFKFAVGRGPSRQFNCKLRARCGGRSQHMRFAHWFHFKWVALVCSQLPPFFAVHFHRWLVVPGCELVARRNPTRVESNSA